MRKNKRFKPMRLKAITLYKDSRHKKKRDKRQEAYKIWNKIDKERKELQSGRRERN